MKKLLTLLVAAAMALAAYPAFATINGTPHDYRTVMEATGGGRCGICHVPHSAAGSKRLWRVALNTPADDGTWGNSRVGQLCATCHDISIASGTITAANILGTVPHGTRGGTVYDSNSHGRDWVKLTGTVVASDQLGASPTVTNGLVNGRPYTGTKFIAANKMECTSCHNPHDDGSAWGTGADTGVRPFLRPGNTSGMANAGVSRMCADCHPDRLNDGTLGASNGTGNHPVDIAYNGASNNVALRANVGGAESSSNHPIAASLWSLILPQGAGAFKGWSLGGKFEGNQQNGSGTGGSAATVPTTSMYIGCQSCHAVHNPDTTTIAKAKGLWLLAEDNTVGSAGLCEGCHGGGTAGNNVYPADAGYGVGSDNGKDHPIDCWGVTNMDLTRWTTGTPQIPAAARRVTASTVWPRSSFTATSGNIICVSCHSAHKATANDKLKRTGGDGTDWCTSCHAQLSPLAHHSHYANYGSSTLTSCGACHGTSNGSAAHHGFNYQFSDAMLQHSELCVNCHYGTNGAAGTRGTDSQVAATNPYPNLDDPVFAASPADDHLINPNRSTGKGTSHSSHYLGPFANSANVHVKRGAWATDVLTMSGTQISSYSKFGSTRTINGYGSKTDPSGAVVICESCHSVLYNYGASASVPGGRSATSGWQNNLLLEQYKDDSAGTATAYAVGAGFCVACHNTGDNATYKTGGVNGLTPHSVVKASSVVPAGTHPMTGWTITRALDAGYVGGNQQLRTNNGGGRNAGDYYAAASSAPAAPGTNGTAGQTVSYPAANQMDCDSCHRPHLAPRAATYSKTKSSKNGLNYAMPVITEGWSNTADEFGDFCQLCHAM